MIIEISVGFRPTLAAVAGNWVVLVTFERMKHKHGRSTHAWWGVEATDAGPQAE